MTELLSDYSMIFVPVIVGGITQVVKYILFSIKHGWDFHYAMTHGHMPSAHTAFIVSLVTAVGWTDGMDTGAFAAAAALAIIVIDDAVRLRMYMGDQGRYLNMLIRQLDVDTEKFPRLKERIGHRVSEVIAGGIFGFALTITIVRILGL